MTRIIVLTLGVLVTVAGLLAAIWVGPSNKVGLGSTELTTATAAMATPTSALNLVGPTLHVTATAAEGEVFVGVGHEIDVDAYLADVAHEAIVPSGGPPLEPISAEFPWQPALEPVAGTNEAPAATPTSRDWWTMSATGPDQQTLEVELADDPLRLVVMNPDGTSPVTADVTLELEIDNAFTTTLLATAAGIGITLLGVLTMRPRRARRPAHASRRSERSEAVHL